MGRAEALAADLARLCDAAAALTAREVAELEAPEAAAAHRQVRAVCDRLLAFAARLIARVEDDGRWAQSGARSFPEWAAGQSRSSVGSARREAALGRALETDLPGTTRAVASGVVTLEHAQLLAKLAPTSDARRAALASDLPDRNEAHLLAAAKGLGADEFGRLVKRWAARVDAVAHEREHRAACARERFVIAPRDGGVAVDGFLTVEHGDALLTALRAVIGVPAKDDKRLPDERRAHALVDLARLALDKGLSGGGVQVRPHISVHVAWETYCRLAHEHGAAGLGRVGAGVGSMGAGDGGAADGLGELVDPAELDSGEPIPSSVLARIACDASVTRIVFGPRGEPLDVGRAQRTFTGAIRRAVIARDRSCRYPGCFAPPMLGEVHHVAWWARDGGPTSVSNGVLLCWHHHDQVHQRNLTIIRSEDGSWRFERADGSRVGGPGDPPGWPDGPGESSVRGGALRRGEPESSGESAVRSLQDALALAL